MNFCDLIKWHFFEIGFTSCKTEALLQVIDLQEKEEEKMKSM